MSDVVTKHARALKRAAEWPLDEKEIRLVATTLEAQFMAAQLQKRWPEVGRLHRFVCWLARMTPKQLSKKALRAMQKATDSARRRYMMTDALDCDTRTVPWLWVSQTRTAVQAQRDDMESTIVDVGPGGTA